MMILQRFLLRLTILSAATVLSHGQTWKQIGPNPISGSNNPNLPSANTSGMVTDIAIDPSGSKDSNIYIGTSAGGVWKTTNGGASWSPTTDSQPFPSIGAISLDPSHPSVVYAGIGGPYCCFGGGGIYRSSDAGGNWSLLDPGSIFVGLTINRIVQPVSGTLIVATNSAFTSRFPAELALEITRPGLTTDNRSPLQLHRGVLQTVTSQI